MLRLKKKQSLFKVFLVDLVLFLEDFGRLKLWRLINLQVVIGAAFAVACPVYNIEVQEQELPKLLEAVM